MVGPHKHVKPTDGLRSTDYMNGSTGLFAYFNSTKRTFVTCRGLKFNLLLWSVYESGYLYQFSTLIVELKHG